MLNRTLALVSIHRASSLAPLTDSNRPDDMPEMPENPEEARRMGVELFFQLMDRSGDGALDMNEFSHWVQGFVDHGEMQERRGEMEDDRRRMEDEREHMREAREHLEDEGAHLDERRRRMEEQRRRMEEEFGGMGLPPDQMSNSRRHRERDEGEHPDEGDMDDRRRRMEEAREHMDDRREHMEHDEGEHPDEGDMDDRRRRMEEAREHMDDRREHMEHEEGEHPDEGDMDDRRRHMEEAREHMDDRREHMEHEEGEHPDEGRMDERRQRMGEEFDPMGDARDRMGDARDRMGDARDRMGDIRDRMEGEGREHMEGMMMDSFHKDAHPDLARLPDASRCSDTLRERELSPREEGVGCRDHEGNLMFRTICNVPGFGAAAISLPAGRAASCFGLEALTGSIGFEIVSEDGHKVWDLSMGPESYEHLKLDEGIYHIKATSGESDGAVTISFVDVSVDR